MSTQTLPRPPADTRPTRAPAAAAALSYPRLEAIERSTYTPRRLDPVSALAALLVAAGAFTSFQYLGTLTAHHREHTLRMVNVLDLPKPPPPEKPVVQKSDPKPRIQPEVVAPPPIVATPAPPPAVAVSATPSPPRPAPVAPAAVVADAPVAPPSPPPTDVGDLTSKMISATPPSYPQDSRRLHEQGTVVLSVLLAADGRVDRVAVAKTSGFYRLDRAALSAVRHWRWSPTLRDGAAVLVQGNVVIPFVLRG